MDLLEKLLVDLHSCIESEDSKIDCVSLVANIEAIALAEMEPSDLEYTTSLLFTSISPPSLLLFLEDSSRSKDREIISAKKNALKFLAQFIKIMPYMVEKIGPDVFKTLLGLFKKETSGEVKSCLLLPAKNLLRNPKFAIAFESDEAELSVDSIYKILLDELHQSASKVGKGLRCEALKTLGLLVFAFPVHPATLSSVNSILTLCEQVLQQNFSKSCKEPDFSAIAGAFSCLDRCLVQFEDRYANSADLWKFLLQAVMATTSSDTSRYAACNKAVRLISHHAELFQQLIGLNAGTSYSLLYNMHTAGKKSMLKHSSNALYTVLRQIAVFVVTHTNTSKANNNNKSSVDTSDAVRTVEKLYTEYMHILVNGAAAATTTTAATSSTNNNTTSTALTDTIDATKLQQEGLMHAVQGLAAIAPAVVVLLNQNNTSGSNTLGAPGTRSVTGTILSIIEAAQHYARYAESTVTIGTSDADSSQPDSAESAGNNMGYDNLAAKHKKVLFLMAVTSFISAVATHSSTRPFDNSGTTSSTDSPITPLLVLTPVMVQFLEEYVVDSIVCYSRFWSKQQAQVCSVLCTLSHAMMLLSHNSSPMTNSTTTTATTTNITVTTATCSNITPTSVYTSLLDCISRTLLLRTVSRTASGETINPSQARLSMYTVEAEDRLLYAYTDLWVELLYPKDKRIKALLMRYYEPDYHTHFARPLYDALFSQVVTMLTTLDLHYENIHTTADATTNSADVIIPTNIADQDILLNLISFLEVLLPQCEQHFDNRCTVWFDMLVPRIITLAEQYPLISALYRLLKCVLAECSSVVIGAETALQLQQGDTIDTSGAGEDNSYAMDVVTATSNINNASNPNNNGTSTTDTVTTLRTFLLSLQQRIHTSSEHYQQELLDAIICLILSSKQILSLPDIINTLKMSLVTGIQVLLSIQLLTDYTLHHKATLIVYLPQLLPLFDSYLTVTNTSNSNDSSNKMYLKSQAATNKMKNKSTKSSSSNSTETTNTNIQISILRLLGRLGGDNKNILSSAEYTVQDMLVWSDRPVVNIDVPLDNDATQLKVCLDIILPRIVTLCTTSSTSHSGSNVHNSTTGSGVDAQCVSAAAETLHAIILYMVGTASSVSTGRATSTLNTSTYEHLLPVVIQLAVSTELACSVVYKDLLFQLIRWFSGHNQVHEKDTLALLDALFNKLSDPAAESSVRDLCANGILEFFLWAIKQSTKAELAKHPGSVESILERVCVLISHPQASQRTAAVIVLRKLYPSFREETSIVHKYTLRVIYLLSKSMRLYEHTTTQQEISEVLLKYERMVVVTVVDRDDAARLVSPAEDRGYPQSLHHLVHELYTNAITSDSLLHRRQCMRSFTALAPLLLGKQTGSPESVQLNGVQTFLQNLAKKEKHASVVDMLISTVHSSTTSGSGTSKESSLLTLHECLSETSVVSADAGQSYTTYMHSFNTKLDVFNWLIKMNYVSVVDLLTYTTNATSTASSAGNKKRKATSDEHAPPSILHTISHFLATYQKAEECLDKRGGIDSETMSAQINTVRREALYRITILLSNIYASARALPDASQLYTMIDLLRDQKVYCNTLHSILSATLLPTTHSTLTNNSTYDMYYAAERLYTQAKYLHIVTECSTIYTHGVSAYINNVLDRTADNTLSVELAENLRRFYTTMRTCDMLPIVFGPNHNVENIKFSASILTNVLSIIHSGTKDGDTSNQPTTSNGTSSPIAINLGAAVLDLCVTMGLAQFPTSPDTTDVPTLVELLLDPTVGSVLIQHYTNELVTLLTTNNATTSILHNTNLQQYVQLAYTNNRNNNAANLRTLFPLVLSALTTQIIVQSNSGNASHSATINTLLSVCTEKSICSALPESVILLLLEASANANTGTTISTASVDKLHEFVLRSCIEVFSGKTKSKAAPSATAANNTATIIDTIITRLKWLPYVIEGTVQGTPLPYNTHLSSTSVVNSMKSELADSLEELAATHFPLHSNSLHTATPEGRNYFKLLKAYLSCFTATGSVMLLSPLIPSLREGAKHRYFGMICKACSDVTNNVAVDGDTSGTICRGEGSQYVSIAVLASYAAKHILDQYQDQVVKHILFNNLLIPTLLRCPADALVYIFTTCNNSKASHAHFTFSDTSTECIVKQLCDIVTTDPFAVSQKSGVEAAVALLYVQSCAYRMLEVVYDRVPLNTIKTTITMAFAGASASGKELTQHICRAAHKQLRAPQISLHSSAGTSGSESPYTALYANAYRCLAIVVAKTQTEEQFFDTFLFKEKPEESVWERMIGEHIVNENNVVINNNIYSSMSGRFATVAIGNVASDYAGNSAYQKQNRLRNVNASSIGGTNILSQYLKGSIVDCSSASQAYDPSVTVKRSVDRKAPRSDTDVNTDSTQQQMDKVLHSDEYSVSQYNYISTKPINSSSTTNNEYNASAIANPTSDLVAGLDDHIIYLELNHINRVPAMSCLVRVIQRMEVLFSNKWYTNEVSDMNMPKWLVELRDKISNTGSSGQTANVRLFILRLFLNQPVASIISAYMEYILPALLNCVLFDLCDIDPNSIYTSGAMTSTAVTGANAKGTAYSYVLRDFVFTVCDTWQCKPSLYCTTQATLLLNYLLQHVYDNDADVLKENTLSVKSLLSLWLPYNSTANARNTANVTSSSPITPAYTIQLVLAPVITLLSAAHHSTGGAHATASSRGTESVRKRLCGLEIVKHLLQINYPLLEHTYSTNANTSTLLGCVLDCIRFPRKEVIESACEVAGLILSAHSRYVSQNKLFMLVPEIEKFAASVQSVIERKILDKGGNDIVATCVRAVTVHYTDFVIRDLLMKTVYNIGRLSPRSKYEYLDMLNRSTSTYSDVSLLNDVLKPHILSFLADLSTVVFGRGKYTMRLPMVCINTLLLIVKHMASLSIDLIESILGGTSTEGIMLCIGANSVLQVRDAAYKVLLSLWRTRLSTSNTNSDTNTIISSGSSSSAVSTSRMEALRKRVIQLLLNGLRDKDTVGMNNTADNSSTDTAGLNNTLDATSHSYYTNPRNWVDNPLRVGIRKQIFSFFESSLAQQGYGLSTSLYNRLHTLMSELYDPAQCSQWLQYSSFLVLTLTNTSPAYSSLLFKHSLADATTFSDMTINTSRTGASGGGVNSMTPLFSLERTSQVVSQLQSSQLGSNSQLGSVLSSSNYVASQSYLASHASQNNNADDSMTQSIDRAERRKGYLRGTQQLSWTQTQSVDAIAATSGGGGKIGTNANSGQGATMNRRAGAYIDTSSTQYNVFGGGVNTQYGNTQAVRASNSSATGSSATSASAGGSSSSSSISSGNTLLPMLPPTSQPARYITTQRVPIRFSQKAATNTSTSEDSTTPNKYSTQSTTRATSTLSRAAKYASVAAMQSSVKLAEERKKSSSRRVVVYRKYRTGELPDISIKLSDILQPLQSLCLYDDVTAGLIFGVLYDAQYKTHLLNSTPNTTSVTNSSSTQVVQDMCMDLHGMLQSARIAGAANTNLFATLLRRSMHQLTLCIEQAQINHTAGLASSTATTTGLSRSRGRGAAASSATFALTTAAATPVIVANTLLLPPELIAECAMQSYNFHSGIQVLEQQLLLLDKAGVHVAATLATSTTNPGGAEQADNNPQQVQASATSTTTAGKKRDIQSTLDSDNESVASTATQSKRPRKGKASTTSVASGKAKATSAVTVSIPDEEEEEATQQVEGLTADELLDNMSSAGSHPSAPAGRRGKGAVVNNTVSKSNVNATSGASKALTPAQVHALSAVRKNIWYQLYRLYDSIGEKHILLGLTAKLGDSSAGANDKNNKALSEVPDFDLAGSSSLVVQDNNGSDGNTDETSVERSVLTKRALDAELSGDYVEAVRIYALLNEQADQSNNKNALVRSATTASNHSEADSESGNNNTVDAVTQNERDLWDERSLLCLKQLCDWQQLHDCVEKITRVHALQSGGYYSERPVWEVLSTLNSAVPAENRLKERLLPHYLQSMLHLSTEMNADNVDSITNTRNNFIERILSYQPVHISTSSTANMYELRQYVESHFPVELALYSASCSNHARSRVYTEQAMQRFLTQWSSIHPCATQARRQLLLQLQPILELRDGADYNTSVDLNTIGANIGCTTTSDGGNGSGVVHKLTHLLDKWSISRPSESDEVSHWSDVTCVRTVALQPTLLQYSNTTSSSNSSSNSGVDNPFVRAKLQLASMHVNTANAAVHQGVLSAVKTQLESNNFIRRSVFGKKAILTMPEVLVVYNYNRRSIDRLVDTSTTGTSANDSTNSDAHIQILIMFTKTMSLLDKKAELLNQNRQSFSSAAVSTSSTSRSSSAYISNSISNAVDTLQLMLLRADWLVKWGTSINYTNSSNISGSHEGSSNATRLLDALSLYNQCSASVDSLVRPASASCSTNNIPTGDRATINELQNHLRTSHTQHCDNLLQYFERTYANSPNTTEHNTLVSDYIRLSDQPESSNPCVLAAIQTVKCFVAGLKCGNSYCIQRVLRMVQIIGQYSVHTQDILRSQLYSIPAWVFLQYAAQLMGSLDRPEGSVICSILEYTASVYPNALYYPYRITSEFLGTTGRANSARLTSLIDNPFQDSFIQALGGLTHPEHRFSDCMKEIDAVYRNAASGGGSSNNLDEIAKLKVQTLYIKLKSTVLDLEWSCVGDKIGAYNRNYARTAKPIIEKLVGAHGEKLYTGSVAQCKKVLEAVRDAINNSKLGNMNHSGGKVALSEFSQYLCDFDPLTCRIEVPGQYSKYNSSSSSTTGGSSNVCAVPNLASHEYITSIDPTLLVMSSIRKPKRITLYGSCGGVYMFLVKGGEDLRNDERIQQLFMLMNSVVGSNSTNSSTGTNSSSSGESAGLKARTYAVIPMTSQVGILEWVPNTVPLKDVISKEMGKDPTILHLNPQVSGPEVDLMRLDAYEKRLLWVKSHAHTDYHKMYKSANRTQATDMYNFITSGISDEFIRRRFVNLSHTAEAYLTIRDQFAKSLAVSSLFGYILGIGDRHLENLLIDVTTGSVIQIDFGICFGMGSSVLQVPELIPFRLTPQLRGVLKPLDGVGLLRHYMVQCMQALRADATSSGTIQLDNNRDKSDGDGEGGGKSASSAKGKSKTARSTTAVTSSVTNSEPPASYSGIIPNALEVYLNDPVVDWLKGATSKSAKDKDRANSSGNSKDGKEKGGGKGSAITAEELAESNAASLRDEWTSLREDISWEPRRRVHLAVQKILGADPSQVLLQDLGVNPWVTKEKSLQALSTIVTNSANSSMRGGNSDSSSVDKGVLSVGEQVDKLINLATDPDILVRQWGGLQTWL